MTLHTHLPVLCRFTCALPVLCRFTYTLPVLHSLYCADLHVHSLYCADLHVHSLYCAELHVHSLYCADLHVHSLYCADGPSPREKLANQLASVLEMRRKKQKVCALVINTTTIMYCWCCLPTCEYTFTLERTSVIVAVVMYSYIAIPFPWLYPQVLEEGRRLLASQHSGGLVTTRLTTFSSPQFLKVSTIHTLRHCYPLHILFVNIWMPSLTIYMVKLLVFKYPT